jgi:hypothetical protein
MGKPGNLPKVNKTALWKVKGFVRTLAHRHPDIIEKHGARAWSEFSILIDRYMEYQEEKYYKRARRYERNRKIKEGKKNVLQKRVA